MIWVSFWPKFNSLPNCCRKILKNCLWTDRAVKIHAYLKVQKQNFDKIGSGKQRFQRVQDKDTNIDILQVKHQLEMAGLKKKCKWKIQKI